MANVQLVQPNLSAQGTVGMCEQFAERVWQTNNRQPSAIDGWNAIPVQYRYLNQEPPADIAVQMYWTYEAYGHTATSVPGRGILSSPWQQGTTQAWLPTRAELERIYSSNGKYPLGYLGWSNYFNGTLVAEEELAMGVTIQGAPVSVSWSAERIDVFACGTDNNLWHKWFDGSNGWSVWENVTDKYLVGQTTELMSVSSWAAERLDLFYRGVAGDLVHIWYDGKSFKGPESLGQPEN